MSKRQRKAETSIDATSRPLATPEWITSDLIRDTQDVWSPMYGRLVSEEEAVEMLLNVSHLYDVLEKPSNSGTRKSQQDEVP